MKILLKKRKGIEVYDVFIDGVKSKWNVSKQYFGTSPFYLVYEGKRLKGRFDNIEEVKTCIITKLLDKKADLILGK